MHTALLNHMPVKLHFDPYYCLLKLLSLQRSAGHCDPERGCDEAFVCVRVCLCVCVRVCVCERERERNLNMGLFFFSITLMIFFI